MIETAVALLSAIMVCFWLFEMSMLVYTLSVLNEAAQEGVRYALVHGSDSSLCSGPSTGCTDSGGANVSAVVKSAAALSLHNVSAMAVSVSWPEATGAKPGSLVRVGVTYTYVPYVKLPGIGQAMTLRAQGRIVY